MLIDLDGQVASINTFLLSCRVLGKNIESAFLTFMLMKLKSLGIKQVTALYIKTSKNEQVKDFYEKAGFMIQESSPDHKGYVLELDKATFELSNLYTMVEV
jgi:predicted enzyme involved in methoxymalonyl-ACP biosynthesis